MKRIFLLFIFLYSSVFLSAQIEIQVGTGSSSSTNVPLTTNFGYNYSQQIYLAGEITAAGGVPTYIHKIRFYTTSNAPANNGDWVVYMKNTAKTIFASTTDWEAGATLTQVFAGTVTFPAANNWMEITLNTPFLWDGVSNILVAVDENQSNWGTLSSWRTTTTVPNNRSMYYRNDSNNPDPMAPPTATGRVTAYPNTQFVMYDGACSGMPVHDAVQVVDNNVCIGDPFTFSTDANNLRTGINYQWQYDSGLGWTNFTTSTNTWSFTTTELTQSADVRVIVTCTNSGLSDTMDLVNVIVNPLPTINITPSSTTFCSGSSTALTAAGASSFSWLPATYLDNSNSANVNATPAASITYTVTGTDVNGCTNTNTTSFSSLADLNSEVDITPGSLCAPGSIVDFSISGLPGYISGGGVYEYRWLDADGITVLQNWSTASNYQFTPLTDDEYTFFYQIRSTTCPAEPTDSVAIDYTVGFGADVSIEDYSCVHPEGIFTLSNMFGQYGNNEIYNNPFNTSDSLSFTGVASIIGGRAVITPSQTGVSGTMLMNVGTFTPGLNNSMEVTFLLTADQPINNFGTGGGDGLTYSFGNDATPGGVGPAQNGKGSKLRLCFDAANNGTENGNASGIYLVYGWGGSIAYGPGSSEVLEYSNNTSLWKLGTDVPVKLSIDIYGKATVTVNGTVVFDDVQLPASYMTENISGWNHLISAATGGDALRHAVDDFQIHTYPLVYGIVANDSVSLPTTWQEGVVFDSLNPGEYNIWISNPDNPSCNRNLGTFTIDNLNPVVELGNDTTICSGDSIQLNAQNSGSSFLWSEGSVTQTIYASESGTYSVVVIDTLGCVAADAIHVDLATSPTADGIYASGFFPNVFLSVMNPLNAVQYNWSFGDGNVAINAPSTIGHTYAAMGTYNVTVTISNETACDSVVLSKTIDVNTVELSVDENELNEIAVYPNPASNIVFVSLKDYTNANIAVYTVAGSLVYSSTLSGLPFNVESFENGVYFIQIDQAERRVIRKLVVYH